jgi:hypothetical protein
MGQTAKVNNATNAGTTSRPGEIPRRLAIFFLKRAT